MKAKKRAIILGSICLVILVGAFIADRILSKNYFKELKYDEVIEKIENKDSFVLLISQTTCTHCISYKPKLEEVANKYKIDIYYRRWRGHGHNCKTQRQTFSLLGGTQANHR